MPIGWNGLSTPANEYSLHIPTNIINSKVRQDSVPYLMEIVLTYISVEGWIVDPDEYRFFYNPG